VRQANSHIRVQYTIGGSIQNDPKKKERKTMEFKTANPSKVSVAERALWLREMAESNRIKQQTYQHLPPQRPSSTTRHSRVSIQERVRMFESRTVAPLAAAPVSTTKLSTSDHPLRNDDHVEHARFQPPPPPQNVVSPSSSESSQHVIEVISTGDTNTSATTSLSSSSYDDPTSPKYGVAASTAPQASTSNVVVPKDPEPLLGLPVTSVIKPTSRKVYDEELQQSKSNDVDTAQELNETETPLQESKCSGLVDDPPLVQFHKEQDKVDDKEKGDGKEEEDDDDIDGHIVKIIKVVKRSPSPLQRPLLSLPWDESDDFSDPWMSNTSILDLNHLGNTDTAKKTSSLQQQLHRLPTTILNPSSLRNHRSQFTTIHPTAPQSRGVVFVDDNISDNEDEDDIQTVDNSTIFNFNHDSVAAITATKHPLSTSLSFDSTFSKMFTAAPASLIQPPPISRYSNSSNGASNDISAILKMNWADVSDEVADAPLNVHNEDNIGRVDRKGLIDRIKSKSTKIPKFEMRKRTASLLCSSKQNHPLLSEEDGVVRSRTTSLDSNNDTTGLWFVKTFDNHDDDMVNILPSTYFPPSPLDIPSFNHAVRLNDDTTMANKVERAEVNIDQKSIPQESGSNPYGIISTLNDPNQNVNRHNSDLHRNCSFPAATSAILGNVFAEEIAADAAALHRGIPTLHAATAVSQKSGKVDSRTFLKSAFTYRSCSTATSTTSTSTGSSMNGSSNNSILSNEGPSSISKSSTSTYHPQPKTDRISSTIAQLCQTNKNAKFQKKSLVQTRKDQLALNLDRNRSSTRNRISKGSWQKDSNGSFKRHFILVDDHHRKTPGL
jgi:hypothetical protein